MTDSPSDLGLTQVVAATHRSVALEAIRHLKGLVRACFKHGFQSMVLDHSMGHMPAPWSELDMACRFLQGQGILEQTNVFSKDLRGYRENENP